MGRPIVAPLAGVGAPGAPDLVCPVCGLDAVSVFERAEPVLDPHGEGFWRRLYRVYRHRYAEHRVVIAGWHHENDLERVYEE